MRILEHACESKICLSKFKFNCDEVDSSVPKPLPQNLNHFMLIVGKPGSSKTTLLLNLMCKRGKMYNKKFDKVYLFSPSLGSIDDCPFEELPDDQKYEELSYEILSGVLEEIKDSGEKVLFIMDDVVNDMKKEHHLEKLLCTVLRIRRDDCLRDGFGIGGHRFLGVFGLGLGPIRVFGFGFRHRDGEDQGIACDPSLSEPNAVESVERISSKDSGFHRIIQHLPRRK